MKFDNTVIGQPFVRTNRIVIDYPAPNTAEVTTTNQEFVRLLDGSYVALGSESTATFTVDPDEMGKSVALSDPNTGEPLGSDMTYGQIMLGILAAIRAHQ